METQRAVRGVLAVATTVGCTAFAVPVAASTPPPKALLVDVTNGSVGGLVLGKSASTYVQKLGLPDYSGAIESPRTQEMLWSLSISTSTAWAVLTLKSAAIADEFRYGGLFRTVNGDRQGTSLMTFQSHWKPTGIVHKVIRKGVTVEYNVAVGRVVFAFDKSKKLLAVGLAPDHLGDTLCIIPSICVVSSLG